MIKAKFGTYEICMGDGKIEGDNISTSDIWKAVRDLYPAYILVPETILDDPEDDTELEIRIKYNECDMGYFECVYIIRAVAHEERDLGNPDSYLYSVEYYVENARVSKLNGYYMSDDWTYPLHQKDLFIVLTNKFLWDVAEEYN